MTYEHRGRSRLVLFIMIGHQVLSGRTRTGLIRLFTLSTGSRNPLASVMVQSPMDQHWWRFMGCRQMPRSALQYVRPSYPSRHSLSAYLSSIDIHPLSIEDMLHNHQTYSSKADYYSKHMFLRILCHTLVDKNHPQPHPVPYGGGSPPPTYSSTDPLTAPPNENIKFQRTNTPAHYDAAPYDPSSEKADKPTNKGLTVPGTEDEKAHRPALKSLASVALFGAQPWVDKHVGGEGIDPERSWAHSVYPNITGKKRRTRAKYSQHMASLFLTPPVSTFGFSLTRTTS